MGLPNNFLKYAGLTLCLAGGVGTAFHISSLKSDLREARERADRLERKVENSQRVRKQEKPIGVERGESGYIGYWGRIGEDGYFPFEVKEAYRTTLSLRGIALDMNTGGQPVYELPKILGQFDTRKEGGEDECDIVKMKKFESERLDELIRLYSGLEDGILGRGYLRHSDEQTARMKTDFLVQYGDDLRMDFEDIRSGGDLFDAVKGKIIGPFDSWGAARVMWAMDRGEGIVMKGEFEDSKGLREVGLYHNGMLVKRVSGFEDSKKAELEMDVTKYMGKFNTMFFAMTNDDGRFLIAPVVKAAGMRIDYSRRLRVKDGIVEEAETNEGG